MVPVGRARIFCSSPEERYAYLLAAGPMDQGRLLASQLYPCQAGLQAR